MNTGRVQSTGDEKSNDLKQLKRVAVFEMFCQVEISKRIQLLIPAHSRRALLGLRLFDCGC